MSAETIRDRALRKMSDYVATEGISPSHADTVALGIERILEALGVRLPNRPPIEDPNAVALAPLPEPGDATAGATAARAALQAARDRRPPPDDRPEPLPPLPDTPGEPE